MAAEAEAVGAAVVILAAVHTSAVAGISAARALAAGISVARASAAPISAGRVSAEPISVVLASAGPGHRGLPRDPVSAVNARLRSTALRAGPPAAPRPGPTARQR